MALTNEDLFAISQLLDVKLDARLKPMENDIKSIKDEQTRINFAKEKEDNPYKQMGLSYIKFASDYPEFFKILFMQKTTLNANDFVVNDAIGEDVRIIKEIIQNCGEGIKKKLAIGINKVDLLGNGEGLKWDELVNLPSDGQKILIDEKCAEIMEQLSNSLGIKMETIAYYSAKKRYRLYDLLNVMIMQSGIKGWKISINPKDWTELCDPRVRELLQKAKEN